MKFYLARHCEAEDGPQLQTDRGLTSLGEAQIPVMAHFLASQTDKIGAVLCSSDLKRGIDTGEALAKKLDVDVVQTPWVDPPNNEGTVAQSDIDRAWKVIQKTAKSLNDGQELLVVSHGPLINALAAWLIGSDQGDKFHFSHGTITHWDTGQPDPATGYPYQGRGDGVIAYLHWMMTPKGMLRAMERDESAVIEEALRIAEAMIEANYTYDEILVKRVTEGSSTSGTCEICEENIAAGWIDSEEVYPSGDDGPEFHPGCVCEEEYKTSRVRVYD